jgi:hypothetical protein
VPVEAEPDMVETLAPAAVEAPAAEPPGVPVEAEAEVVDTLADDPRATPGASSGRVG